MTIASPGREQQGPEQLQKILDSIAAGKADEAIKASQSHVLAAAAIANQMLDQKVKK